MQARPPWSPWKLPTETPWGSTRWRRWAAHNWSISNILRRWALLHKIHLKYFLSDPFLPELNSIVCRAIREIKLNLKHKKWWSYTLCKLQRGNKKSSDSTLSNIWTPPVDGNSNPVEFTNKAHCTGWKQEVKVGAQKPQKLLVIYLCILHCQTNKSLQGACCVRQSETWTWC